MYFQFALRTFLTVDRAWTIEHAKDAKEDSFYLRVTGVPFVWLAVLRILPKSRQTGMV